MMENKVLLFHFKMDMWLKDTHLIN